MFAFLETVILSDVRQRKTNIRSHLYVESKKNGTNEHIYVTEMESYMYKTK